MFDLKPAAPRRWFQLVLGLASYGVASALMIRSQLGLGPWDMFHQGLSRLLPVSVGVASIGVGLALLGLLLFARVRFGWGTLANIILIGAVTDLALPWIAEAGGRGWQLGYYALALPLAGLGIGLYIGADMGAGPRDSLMLWLSQRTAWPVRRVRTLIELGALAGGWLMGGRAGLGTLLFALAIGPAAQWGMRLFKVELGAVVSQQSSVARAGLEA